MKHLITFLAATAFANANAASKLFVCATPQNVNLAQADYEGLTWVEIKGVGELGETGKSTNIITYETWGDAVVQKAKGLTDAGSPDLECARDPNDAGQNILVAGGAVGNVNNYAFKELRNDGTVRYNRGLVGGPKYPGGRNEDFDLQVFSLGFQQEPIIVAPSDGGAAPSNTVLPAITGTAEVGEELSVSTGTFTGDAPMTNTYQWFAGGVAIAGATSSTFDLTSAQLGKIITARVTATNASGSASAYSGATAAVAP